MPSKYMVRASLSETARKKLDAIVAHEQAKFAPDIDGNPIPLKDTKIIEGLIDVRYELIAGGVTNRQRLGGMSDELSALRAEIIELKETIKMLADLITGGKPNV